MEINETYLTISGKFPIEDDLVFNKEYTYLVTFEVVKEDIKNNHDGTFDRNSIVKPLAVTLPES